MPIYNKKSLRINFILNNIRLFVNLLLPIIIFSYVSRTLSSYGLGKVEFANSIASFFVLFTALGIPVYGIRLISRNKDDVYLISRNVIELSIILLATVFLGYIIYFLVVFNFSIFHKDIILYLVISPTLLLSNINFEWFYIALEDQLYITIRAVSIKIIQIILIFLLIKKMDDYVIYAGILIGLNGLSTFFNVIHLRKYLVKVKINDIRLLYHFKPMFIIFASIISMNVYMHLDVTMIGLFIGDSAVGLYVAANKLVRIIIIIITSISTVMIPKLENNISKNNYASFFLNLKLSIRFMLMFSIPFFLGIFVLSPEIISVFAGPKYLEATSTIRLLSIIILIVPIANFVGLQILYPTRKEKYYTVSVTVAAIVNFFFNLLLIPRFAQNGAVMGTIIAELIGLIIQMYYARSILFKTDLFTKNTIKYFISGILMLFVIYFIKNVFQLIYLRIFFCIILGGLFYFLSLFLLHESLTRNIIKKVFSKKIVNDKN